MPDRGRDGLRVDEVAQKTIKCLGRACQRRCHRHCVSLRRRNRMNSQDTAATFAHERSRRLPVTHDDVLHGRALQRRAAEGLGGRPEKYRRRVCLPAPRALNGLITKGKWNETWNVSTRRKRVSDRILQRPAFSSGAVFARLWQRGEQNGRRLTTNAPSIRDINPLGYRHGKLREWRLVSLDLCFWVQRAHQPRSSSGSAIRGRSRRHHADVLARCDVHPDG